MLEKSGYKVHYASGRGKKHGCLIGYKKELYTFVSEKIVYYDEQHIGTTPDQDRIGASFKTKNIGYMVAIKSKTNENEGIIAATTHLFWHPKSGLILSFLISDIWSLTMCPDTHMKG